MRKPGTSGGEKKTKILIRRGNEETGYIWGGEKDENTNPEKQRGNQLHPEGRKRQKY